MPIKTLKVPYFVQPTAITCQSTCLKMFGKYMESKIGFSSPGPNQTIQQIWQEINTGIERPVQVRNAYANMRWWLEKYFQPYQFEIFRTDNVDVASRHAVDKIDGGFPIMVSTNHDRTNGHIILVIGYQSSSILASGNVDFICHDPYGKFDPQLSSEQYGRRRFEGGSSLESGGEHGPGQAVIYDYEGIRRIRDDRHSSGRFFMISARD
ncbi:MAG: C39 family peptidase [Geminicoccaceae bacterium]